MNYQFTKESKKKSAEALWKAIRNGLSEDVIIKSTKDKLYYTVNEITADEISFSAPTRSQGAPEIISCSDFITVVSKLQKLQQFNTSSAKELFKGTLIYKKRSPFFAVLLSAGVIERVD